VASRRSQADTHPPQNFADCVEYDPLAMKTLGDLRWGCLLQLDLIEEGQDSTEGDDPKPSGGGSRSTVAHGGREP
jgi:hypothetical protein